MKKAILLRIFIVLALLLGLFYIIYNDYKQAKPAQDGAVADIASSTPVANLPVATSTVVANSDKPAGTNKDTLAFKLPNLNRQYTMPASVDVAMGAQAVKEISEYSASLKENPDQFGRWLDLALIRKAIEDYTGAEEIWVFVSKEWPDSFVAYNNLGDLYTFYLKDYPKAEANLKMVIRMDSHKISTYRDLYMLYTNQYTEKKSEALPILLAGIKANPKSTDLLVLAGTYYKDAGDKTNAKEYYSQALWQAEAMKNPALVDYLKKEISNLSS